VGVTPSEQLRYAKGKKKCGWRRHIFHGLNDWHISRIGKANTMTPALDSIADAEFEEAGSTGY
jgi:hypothetical protein